MIVNYYQENNIKEYKTIGFYSKLTYIFQLKQNVLSRELYKVRSYKMARLHEISQKVKVLSKISQLSIVGKVIGSKMK